MYSTWCMTRSPGDQLQCGAILPQTSRCSTVESQHRTFPTLLRNNTDNCGTAVFLHCTLLKHVVSPFIHPNLVWRVKHRNISLDPAVLAVVSDRAPPGPGLSRALRCQWMQVQSFLSGHLFTHIQHSLYEIMIPPFHKDTKKSRMYLFSDFSFQSSEETIDILLVGTRSKRTEWLIKPPDQHCGICHIPQRIPWRNDEKRTILIWLVAVIGHDIKVWLLKNRIKN